MRDTLKGALFVIAAMFIFGFMGIFVRFLNLPSHVIVFFNFLFTSIILFVIFLIKDRRVILVRKYWWIMALLGLFNVLNNFFYYQAYVKTTISNAVLTHYTAPIFVALLAPFILKEKLEKITIAALAISIVGLFIISYQNLSFQSKELIGISYGTASGLMYALVIITIKHLTKCLSIFSVNIYHSFIGSMILLPFVSATDFKINANVVFLLVLFALIFGIIATLIHFAGIKRIKSQHAGILAYLEPIVASFYAFIFFFEVPSFSTVVGGLLILFSGYIILRREK